MEENIQEVKKANCMEMPVEEDQKTKGKKWIEKKEKNKGKLIFLRRNAFTEGSEKKMIRLFMENCEGQGQGQEKKWKGK